MSETTENTTPVDMITLARERDFEMLEAEWMKQVDKLPDNLDELFRVADYLIRRDFNGIFNNKQQLLFGDLFLKHKTVIDQ